MGQLLSPMPSVSEYRACFLDMNYWPVLFLFLIGHVMEFMSNWGARCQNHCRLGTIFGVRGPGVFGMIHALNIPELVISLATAVTLVTAVTQHLCFAWLGCCVCRRPGPAFPAQAQTRKSDSASASVPGPAKDAAPKRKAAIKRDEAELQLLESS